MSSKTVMRSGIGVVALAIACMVFQISPAAHGQQRPVGAPRETPRVIESFSKPKVLALMKAEGYAVDTDAEGDIVWKIDGFRTVMFVFDDGASLQFYASFGDGNATLKKVNEWNKRRRYSRSYLDEDGDPVLELDLGMSGGVTVDRIKEFFKTCRASYQAWCVEVIK